ncbi:D-alanine--poly(phosphoribitol) ligase subunit DltA [Lysinibacillus xylanilyticus]|uniref:D-alanine--poly(phosphoribitol) ligase subunit DltA n=1 Tax=Lysinibacillus xylanilyticus TaxID=582475 RepID=UPI003D008E57
MKNIYSNILNLRKDNFFFGINVIYGLAKYKKEEIDVERYIASAKLVVKENQIFESKVTFIEDDIELFFDKVPNDELVEVLYMKTEEQVVRYINTIDVIQEFERHNNRIITLKIFVTDEYLFLGCIGHHSISDGRAMYLLINEIGEVYQNHEYYKINNVLKFPNNAILSKQKEYLESNRYKRDYEYWQKKMGEIESLPSDLYLEDAERYVHYISNELLNKVFTVTKTKKIDLLSLLLLAISSIEPLIHGEKREKTVLGFVTDTRKKEEYSTMNMFVNNICLVSNDLFNNNISESLAVIRNEIISSLRHSKFPVAKYFEGKYNILISYHKIPDMPDRIRPINEYWKGPEKINVPMIITFKHRENDIYIECDYKKSKFKGDFISKYFKLFEFVLNEILECFTLEEEEKIKLLDIPLVKKREINNTLDKSLTQKQNGLQEAIYENLLSLHKKAIVLEDEYISYAQLNRESEKLANYLHENNISKAVIWGDVNFRYLVGIVGSIKAGVTYIPLSNRTPKNHFEFIREEHSPILLNSNLEEREGFKKIDTILSECSSEKKMEWDVDNEEVCIIYTSGTTGNPKGIPIKNTSIDNVIRQQNELKVEENDHLLLIADISFDISLFSIYGSLANGATLVLINNDKLFEEGYLKSEIEKFPNSITCITPALIRGLPIDTWDHMKFLTCGGEKMDIDLAKELLHVKGTRIFNAYGPTEATILCTLFELDKCVEQLQQVPIGKPIKGIEILIIDCYGRVLPNYFQGELLIRGAGVLSHYYSSDKEPFIKIYDENYYRTGDLCISTQNGIQYLNRLDNQVKINGYRIEIDAIEKNLREILKEVNFVIDVFKESIYVYTTEELEISKINNELKERLPEYMIPKVYICVDTIPLTKNHKVDFQKLRNRLESATLDDLQLEDKINVLQEYMGQVLNVREIKAEASFFTYGGNSLKAMELAARINEDYDSNLTSIDILKYKNAKTLANNIFLKFRKSILSKKSYQLCLSETPLSNMQQMMVIDFLLNPNTTKYLMCKVYEADSIFNAKQFVQAFEKAINNHDIFKIKIKNQNGSFVQKVNENFKIQKEMKSLDVLPNWSNFIKPFDLFNDSLVRLTLFNINQRYFILIEMHHICADAHTIIHLLEDVQKILNGQEMVKEKSEIDFSYYVNYEKEKLSNSHLIEMNEKLVQKFKGLKRLKFPTIYNTSETNHVHYNFNKEIFDSIKAIQQTLNVSLQTVVLSALGYLGYKVQGEHEFTIGMPVNLRDQMILLNVLGPVINTVPCKISINPNDTVAEYIAQVQEEIIMAIEYKDIPLSMLQKGLSEQGSLFDVVIVVQDKVDTEKISGMKEINTPLIEEKFKMTYQFTEKEHEVVLDVSFKEIQITEMNRLITLFEETLLIFCTRLLEKVSDLQLNHNLSVVENKSVLPNTTIWDYILKSAEHTPNQIALFRTKKSYVEMVKDINHLTASLLELGVKKGDMVAIDYERTDAGVMLQLAMSRLGAAYVPLNSEISSIQAEEILKSISTSLIITPNKEKRFSDINHISFENLIENKSAVENTFNLAEPSDILYVMFSSGTTGKPKGIKIAHSSVISFIIYGDFYTWNPGDRIAQISNNGFDGSTYDIYRALFNSGELHVISTDIVKNPILLYNYIKDHRINSFFIPASYYNLLVDAFDLRDWEDITQMYIGGERLSEKHVEKGLEDFQGQIINGYGPTETTVFISTECITKETFKGPIPLGKPLKHHKVYVLDEDLNPVPKGVVGELYVGGPGVCEGLINALDEDYLIWNKEKDEKIYKTGDFVLMDEDEKLFFIGRKDDQIKHNGYRINLTEIEKIIEAIPNVERASTLYIDKKIIAFIQLKEESELLQVQKEIENKVPKYMKPNRFIEVDQFELTINGKIDREKLKKLIDKQLQLQ